MIFQILRYFCISGHHSVTLELAARELLNIAIYIYIHIYCDLGTHCLSALSSDKNYYLNKIRSVLCPKPNNCCANMQIVRRPLNEAPTFLLSLSLGFWIRGASPGVPEKRGGRWAMEGGRRGRWVTAFRDRGKSGIRSGI